MSAMLKRFRVLSRHWTVALGLLIAVGNCRAGAMNDEGVEEYQMKAAFLYNFARFVTWPAGLFAGSGDSVTICVAGKRLGQRLDEAAQGRAIEGHSLVIRHISGLDQAAACHILYVDADEEKNWRSALAGIAKSGVLTVGESNGAAAARTILNFTLEENRVRFDVNLTIANREKLQISSRLLSLARTVRK